ncbi:MAG: hypothetical protein AAGF30_00550 [Pseudomonadota bacterium]
MLQGGRVQVDDRRLRRRFRQGCLGLFVAFPQSTNGGNGIFPVRHAPNVQIVGPIKGGLRLAGGGL